ncbi:MAG: AAA family ATPase [Rhodocyclaceae bacterium]|nr:MAG: AAA family ATPase [Rhodocyclaceae bacterium]
MYLQHFGLTEFPFGITPDTSFTFSAHAHQEALNTLLVALQCGEGFVKITGEVGTGKTLLCRRLLQTLGDSVATAYLPNPNLEPQTLLLALAEELRVTDASGLDQYHLLRRINHALLDFARAGKRVVLCIDEAQAMPLDTLEALRLVSNLETEKRKLIQIVLFGQPELDEKLSDPSVRQLLQRITFHQRLVGLGKEEIALYLQHRMRVAGYRGEPLFTAGALRALRRATRGTPRLINVLAHKSLLSAFGEGRQVVKFSHVKGAARDTEGARSPGWW